MARQVIVVTGAARSGKSEWAERLAVQSGKAVIYVATARRSESDREWDDRIVRHQVRRPEHWKIVEVPEALPTVLMTYGDQDCLLVDSLGTWVGNGLERSSEDWAEQTSALLRNLEQSVSTLIFVAEETGWGVVPAYSMGRLFRDRLGHLTRTLGQVADRTFLVTAGHALDLSHLGVAIDR